MQVLMMDSRYCTPAQRLASPFSTGGKPLIDILLGSGSEKKKVETDRRPATYGVSYGLPSLELLLHLMFVERSLSIYISYLSLA